MSNANQLIRYKVAISGNGNVGKTTLLRRYATGKFQESRIMTIGVDFETIEVDVKGQPVKLTVWDLAGQQRFAPFRDSFYRGARAIAMVFDVSDRPTFDDLPHWLQEAQRVVPDAYVVVNGNKIDLPRVIAVEEGRAYAASINAAYVETSAKTGEGVGQFFRFLAMAAHARR
jgi:Ras-related protein Rab-18